MTLREQGNERLGGFRPKNEDKVNESLCKGQGGTCFEGKFPYEFPISPRKSALKVTV